MGFGDLGVVDQLGARLGSGDGAEIRNPRILSRKKPKKSKNPVFRNFLEQECLKNRRKAGILH
jgi:hypothetical protein